ncbi:hypothetical protein WG66_007938 [Moniliophthora roreri]|nr:hypothetical protein WG66_007938 [Moniliophthora roreri]
MNGIARVGWEYVYVVGAQQHGDSLGYQTHHDRVHRVVLIAVTAQVDRILRHLSLGRWADGLPVPASSHQAKKRREIPSWRVVETESASQVVT